MVSTIDPTNMGTAVMVIRTCMERALCNYYCELWICRVFIIYQENSFCRRVAIYFEYSIQYCVYSDTVWIKKQPARIDGYRTRTRDIDMGTDCDLSVCKMGEFCEYSISRVGMFCNGTTNYRDRIEFQSITLFGFF